MTKKINYLNTAVTFTLLMSAFACNATVEHASANMNVYLTVLKSCTVSVSDMSFGNQFSNSGDQKTDTNATVTCTPGTGYKLSVDAMKQYELKDNSGNKVTYTLYADQAGKVPMITGTTETGTGSPQQLKIYGKIAADSLQDAHAGIYKDTVSILVDY